MVLNAGFGTTYAYRDIAGYAIQAGLLSQQGLGTRFGVYLFLGSNIEGPLPVLPIYDEALDADEPWKEELRIATPDGELVGAIGVSGDSSCADHVIAWKVRHMLNLDNVPTGLSETDDDNIDPSKTGY